MRRWILWALCALLCHVAHGQVTRHFRDTPLTEALRSVERGQTAYTIAIRSDGLAGLRTSARVKDRSVADAVGIICRGLPVKVKTRGREITVQYSPQADRRRIWLSGKVYDEVTRLELPHAMVRLMTADGKTVDSCEAISRTQYNGGPVIEHSDFSFAVPAYPADYVIRATYVGYAPTEMPYAFDNVFRREQRRELPPVYMKREARRLKEAVVTATKVQFYYKGDTLVFNADAFELAEGSMLDALVRQLPGIELKEGGRIYHNGKYVDALLLNGKDFFRGDHTIMLENLAAYTVKDIRIYDKWGEKSEFLGQHVAGDRRYVMDVKLKMEYSVGSMANAEAGGGSDGRYLARLFALRFADHSRIAAYATANNLNGDAKPGQTGSWDPKRLKDGGMLTQQQGGIDYSLDDRGGKWKADGNVQLSHGDTDRQTQAERRNFLPAGDTYDRIRRERRDKDLNLSTSHNFSRNFPWWHLQGKAAFDFRKYDNASGFAALATRQDGSLLHSTLQRGLYGGHRLGGSLRMGNTFKFPKSPDWASLDASLSFSDAVADNFLRQQVNYAEVAQRPAEVLNRYARNHPERAWKAEVKGTYQYNITQLVRLQFNANYTHDALRRESSVFDLDTIHPFGQLPSEVEYLQGINRALSCGSRLTADEFALFPRLLYNWYQGSRRKIWAQIGFPVAVSRRSLHYRRGSIDTAIVHRTMPVNISDCFIEYKTFNEATSRRHSLFLQYTAQSRLPDLGHFVDMRDDADPLNVYVGNGNLRAALSHQFSFTHTMEKKGRVSRTHHYSAHYHFVRHALAMSGCHDPATGIRTWQAVNVNGNYDLGTSYSFHANFGKKFPVSLSIAPDIGYTHSVDMVDGGRSTVNTLALANGLTLSCKLGSHTLDLKSDILWQRFGGERGDFATMRPLTLTHGVGTLLKLPWRLELNTSLTLYTRTGYADGQLNDNDLVWNARLSRAFSKGRFLIMLDALDILGQLDNVSRTVNAQGRTETRVNVLPRYVLLHAVYRFNKQPKKRGA